MKDIRAYDKFSLISGIIMVLVYFGVGVFIFLSDAILSNIAESNRKIFGIAICIYGTYRGYKAYKKYVEIKNEIEIQKYEKH